METKLLSYLETGKVAGTDSSTDLGQSKYNFSYLTFPDDLGMDYSGHYMIININVPTKGFRLVNGRNMGDPAGNFTSYFTTLEGADARVSKVDRLRYGSGGVAGGDRPLLSLPRQTRRIAESIALFMPNQSLAFSDANIYKDISLTEKVGGVVGGAAKAIGGALSIPFSGSSAGGEAIGGAIAGGASTAAQIMSNPINPAVEILFDTKVQRQFTFTWLMAPRNKKESESMWSIIKTLRFHASPEINTEWKSATWIPPADFDISFYNKGFENTNIQRINTCVLERIDVEYEPQGIYATFTNGHPVAAAVILQFRELEVAHKLRILQGF